MSTLCAQKVLRDLRVALFLFFWLIFARRKSKRGFRVLRDATQGNGARVLGPWPNKSATALRENAPQGPFLVPQGFSKGLSESFSSALRAVSSTLFSAEKNLRFAEDDASNQIFRFIFPEKPYLLACGIKILTKIPSSRSSFS